MGHSVFITNNYHLVVRIFINEAATVYVVPIQGRRQQFEAGSAGSCVATPSHTCGSERM